MSSPKDLTHAKASEVIFPARRSWTTSRQSATSLILKKRGAERAARRVIDHGPLLFWPGIGHATPKNRSSDGTLINLRAPIFVHSISPLFILL
jgi:hypothetical protein